MDDNLKDKAAGIRSLERGLALLKAMNDMPHASVTTIAAEIGVPRSTAYRLLDTLVMLGYVQTSSAAGSYNLTREVYRLSKGFLDEDWIEGAWLELVELGKQVIWPVDLFTPEAATMIVRRSTHERSTMSIDYGMTGRRLPMTETASGRAYLAFCPAAERELIFKLPGIFVDGCSERLERAIFERTLDATRARGFGTRMGGVMPKTASIGVPVMIGDAVLCCVSIIWIASAFSIDRAIDELGKPLLDAAERIRRVAQHSLEGHLSNQFGRA